MTGTPRLGPEEPSSRLLNGLRQGDQEAWGRFDQFYTPLVRHWARRVGVAGQDLADVVQEVLKAVARRLPQYERQRGSFAAWICTITRSRGIDHLRGLAGQPRGAGGSSAQARLEEKPDPLEEASSPQVTASAEVLLRRRVVDVVQGEFEPHTWQAFWRSVIDGRDTAAVAAELGMSAGAVRIARSRVVNRLRAVYEEVGGAASNS
jgi:RNA polymerase sigma-70 factor (ECF subfamily)